LSIAAIYNVSLLKYIKKKEERNQKSIQNEEEQEN